MIRIEALGGIRILIGNQESLTLAKQRLKCGLLVYLAVERTVMREALIGVFWPDREPERARHALSQNLYELRKLLGEEWLVGAGDRLTIAEHVTCDAVEFSAAAEAGELQRALQLYRGPFLDGSYLAETREFEEWIDRRQDRLGKVLRRTLRDASQLEENPPWSDLAIDVARRSAERDLTDDDIQHAFIQLLVRTGRRSDALRHFERYEAALKEDGLEPLEHTRQLIAIARESPDVPEPARIFPLPEAPPEPPSAQNAPAPLFAERKQPRRHRAVAAGLVIVGVAAFLPWLVSRADNSPESAQVKAAEPRIAVLYFENRSPDGKFTYLASAFTEGLIDAFSNVPGIEVRSSAAVKFYRDHSVPQDSIAGDLDVNYLVDGSVEEVGDDQLRVTVRLVDVENKVNLRSEPITRASRDFASMRDDIVQEAAVQLRQRLGRELDVRARRLETRNSSAWDQFLRARQIHDDFVPLLLSNGVDAAERTLVRADSMLAAAERSDRTWNAPIVLRGRVASMHAQVVLYRSGLSDRRPIRAAIDNALAHANRALRNQPNDAAALELRGAMTYRLWFTETLRPDEDLATLQRSAEADLRKAVDLDRQRVEAASILSEIFYRQARYAEAELAASQAYAADRYYAGAKETLFGLATAQFEQGKETASGRSCREGERRFPQSHQFMHCRLMLLAWGDSTPADPDSVNAVLSRLQQLHQNPPNYDPAPMFNLIAASAYLRAGRRADAERILDHPRPNTADASLLWVEAAARARMGEMDSAFSLVSRFVASQRSTPLHVLNSRALAPLRGHPGFAELRPPAR